MSQNYERFFPAHIIFASTTAWRGSMSGARRMAMWLLRRCSPNKMNMRSGLEKFFAHIRGTPFTANFFTAFHLRLPTRFLPCKRQICWHELSEYWATIEYQRSPTSTFCIRSSLAKGEEKLDSLPLGGMLRQALAE